MCARYNLNSIGIFQVPRGNEKLGVEEKRNWLVFRCRVGYKTPWELSGFHEK